MGYVGVGSDASLQMSCFCNKLNVYTLYVQYVQCKGMSALV